MLAELGLPSFNTFCRMLSAFDTVDHDILLTRLSRSFGVRGDALNWMRLGLGS